MDVYIYTQKQKKETHSPPHLTKFVPFYSISEFCLNGYEKVDVFVF